MDGRFEEVPGSEREIPADLVLLAMGFAGPEPDGLVEQLGVDARRAGQRAPGTGSTPPSVDGVFVAGDAGRGQSLIVWAIAEGRSCAAAVDRFLTGTHRTCRPRSTPNARPLTRLSRPACTPCG